jgi:LysM repeat protein
LPPRRQQHVAFARYAAPAVFVAAVTVAILLVRAGLDNGGGGGSTAVLLSTARATTARTSTAKTRKSPHRPKKRYYVIQSGDTFGTIASKFQTTVEALQALNPDASSTSLSVGQRIRIK